MKSLYTLSALLLGLGLVGVGCKVELDDDDDDDNDTADDDTADDDTVADDDTMADDDTVSDDDTFPTDDDSFVAILQYGEAALSPSGTWTNWDGMETYNEWIGDDTTCDLGFTTFGDRTDSCDFCDFTFDVSYIEDYDNSTPDCYYTFAPTDGETISFGYYYYYGYGFMMYYVTYGAYYGFYYWGMANVDGDNLTYYFSNY